MKNKKIIS